MAISRRTALIAAVVLAACTATRVDPAGPAVETLTVGGAAYRVSFVANSAASAADPTFRIATMTVGRPARAFTDNDEALALGVVRAWCSARSDPVCLRVKDNQTGPGSFDKGQWLFQWAVAPGAGQSLDPV